MNRKFFFIANLIALIIVVAACTSPGDKTLNTPSTSTPVDNTITEGTDPKGIGKYKDVELTHPLDEKMVASGKNTYDVKCASCHKTTGEKLVGPGWKGVTDRRTPEWIMNFTTNTEEMIEKDAAAKQMLEVCLVRMPNQNVAEVDARALLEYMRKIDGKQ